MKELHIVIELEEVKKIVSDNFLMGQVNDSALCMGSSEETRIYKTMLGDNEVLVIVQPLDDDE